MYIMQEDIKEHICFIPQNASLVDELAETMDCITMIEKDIKTTGGRRSVARCKKLDRKLMLKHERQRCWLLYLGIFRTSSLS